MANEYATLTEFQKRTSLDAAELIAKTDLINAELERNSRLIDKITGARFYKTTLTASKVRFDYGYNSDNLVMSANGQRIYFPSNTIVISEIKSDDVTLTVDEDYFIGTHFIEANSIFSCERINGVVITGTCGSDTVPPDVVEICLAMTEVTTGLGTYTMKDSGGSSVEVTRDNLPEWVEERIFMHIRFDTFG